MISRHSDQKISGAPGFRADPHQAASGFHAVPFLQAPLNGGFQARTPGLVVSKPVPKALDSAAPTPADLPDPLAAPQPVLPRRPPADPEALAAARAEGHATGLSEGRARAEADLAAAHADIAAQAAALARALVLLENPPAADLDHLTKTLQTAIAALASDRAGQAIDDNPAPFANRLTHLVQQVARNIAEAVLYLHPDDLAAILPLLENLPDGLLAKARLVANPTIPRGDAKLCTPGVEIEDTPYRAAAE